MPSSRKFKIIAVGKINNLCMQEEIRKYIKRLSRYANIDIEEISNIKGVNTKDKECKKILSKIKISDYIIVLDEKGKEFSSEEFAVFLEKKGIYGIGNITFIIGGAFGLSENIYKRANTKITISRMTFPHQMIRLFFIEQLYRSMTIINGEDYHH